jgi:hypothetical protein
MAYREFIDDRGRDWKVWDVYPSLAERRLGEAGPPPGRRERRRLAERRLKVRPSLAHGWLTFESRDGERRRLAPIPKVEGGWATATEDELNAWCAAAEVAPSGRRLIE